MKLFPTRELAEKKFTELGEMPKLIVCGETGDVLMSHGDQNQQD